MQNNFKAGPNDMRALPEGDFHTVKADAVAGQDFTKVTKDVVAFADAHNVSLTKAAGHLIEPDDESDKDIIVDVLERNGIALTSGRQGPSTDTAVVFNDAELAAWGTEYVQEVFFSQIHDEQFWQVGTGHSVGFAGRGSARGDLPTDGNAFNPPTIVPIMGDKILYQDLEIADIIGSRREIMGSKVTLPKVTEPKNWKLTNIGEFGEIPKFRMGVGEQLEEIAKCGWAYEVSYEFLRTPGSTMEALALFAMWLAFNATRDIVDEGLQLAFSGATAYSSGAATLDRKSAIKMLAQREKGTQINLVVGNLDFFVEYGAVDWTLNSNEKGYLTYDSMGATRTFLNTPMGQQLISYRTGTEVAAVAGSDPIAGAIDRRFVLEYFFERNSNIEETDMNRGQQAVNFYKTFNYGFAKMVMANDARHLFTLA